MTYWDTRKVTPETFIKRQIKQWLKGEAVMNKLIWWNNVAGIGSWPGLGDIGVLKAGKYYEFEVKSQKGKPSPLQLDRAVVVNKHGGSHHIVRSWEEVRDILQ